MKIIQTRVLSGPNIWSIRRTHLIEMLVDLEELADRPTDTIDGFYERLMVMLPSMYKHRCSEGREGGFFSRVKNGTWMGHVMEHIALELQTLADMETGFGRTRESDTDGIYHVVYSYKDAEAGVYAGHAALRIINALTEGKPYDISNDLLELKKIWQKNKLGPSTGSIVHEAVSRNIPWIRIDEDSYIQLGYGKNQQRIEATIAGTTGSIAVDTVCDKGRTKYMLSRASIPVPSGVIISDLSELDSAIETVGFPLVIKPLDGNHGNGATTNIDNITDAQIAFARAKEICHKVICEKFIEGQDYRVLVINYKFIAAAKRTPAFVTGDGIHCIRELVKITNDSALRGDGHENILTAITLDEVTQEILSKRGYTLESIPENGEKVCLKPTANLSTGGTAEDVTDDVHPANVAMFERAARLLGLNICGIDVMSGDLCTPLVSNGGAILEVNAAPGFRMHLQPSEGSPRNVARPVVDMLFPNKAEARIPIVAIAGRKGKSTTCSIIAHIAKKAGFFTGHNTREGVHIGDELIEKKRSALAPAQLVLRDPAVDFAVLQCTRKEILTTGLPFDQCDVAVVTNIERPHTNDDERELYWMSKVESVVPEAVVDHGLAILNADDDYVYEMKMYTSCRVALFSVKENNTRIKDHCLRGGLAAVFRKNSIYILRGSKEFKLEEMENIPCVADGRLYNVPHVLAAVLACIAQKIPVTIIQQGIRTYTSGPQKSLVIPTEYV